MNLRKLIILFLFLFTFGAKATTRIYLDSLLNVLNTTNEPLARLNCLYTLSFEYGFIDPPSGIRYGWQCLDLAKRESNLHYQLNAYNGIANSYETLAKYDSACYFHTLSYEIAKKMGVPQKIALTLFNVGLCYKELGEYEKALKYYLTAYRLFERDSVYNPRIHFYLGEMYLKMGNYKDAEYQSRLGIKKCKEFNHDYVIYNLYINLAKCLSQRNQIDSAKHLLNSTLQGLLKHTDENSIAICYNALGELYLSCKEYEKAYANFDNELQIQKKLNNHSGQQLAYLNLAYCVAHTNPSNSVLIGNYVSEAEKLFPAITKNDDLLLESYRKMAETNEIIKNTIQSVKYYKLYYALRDTLMNKEKLRLVYDLQTKYETEKKEKQIKSLELSGYIKSLQIKKRNMYILLTVLLVVFVAIFAYLLMFKQQLKAKYDKEMAIKRTEEKERIRMAKDIHDDLGSGLSKINFLSELISRDKSLSKEVSENATSIAETAKRLVVNMRDLIWALDPENVTLEGLVARIREYAADYLEDVSVDLNLSTDKDIPALSIKRESHRELLMVVKESLNNIVKHSKANQVDLKISFANQVLSISIKDNGTGIPESARQGNGLKNMRNRIESIGGMFNLKTDSKGTLIEVVVPLLGIHRK